jgi:hypothetical protein
MPFAPFVTAKAGTQEIQAKAERPGMTACLL